MEQAEFTALVERLTEESRRAPAAYRRKVMGVVALGHLGIGGMLLLALAMTVGAVALLIALRNFWLLKIVWIPVVFGVVILKSLWIEVPLPEGTPLERATSPELFEEIDGICARMDVPRIHRVLAVPDDNAAVAQVPRLGLLGWHRSYLLLGLPLMQGLSREQFRAVVAHELGHLSRSHGRFSNRVHTMRTSWIRMHDELQQGDHFGQVFVRGFLNWYVPRLDVYATVLARSQEYDADQAGAAMTSRDVMAAALARTQVVSRYLAEEHWPAVFARALTEPEPPRSVYADLGRALERPVAPEKAAAWLAAARAEPIRWGDTHPSFSARLQGLGLDAPGIAAVAPALPSVADLLGAALPALIREFDAEWFGAAQHPWRVRRHEADKARARRVELQERAAREGITPEERQELVRIALLIDGRSVARAEAERLVSDHPDESPPHFFLGWLLLGDGDGSGLEHLDRAMKLDPEAIESSCDVAITFLESRGRVADAERYKVRWEQRRDLLRRAGAERELLEATDRFEPHALAGEPLDHVVSALRLNPDVACAFLVRRAVDLMPEVPHHALVVVPRLPGFRPDRPARRQALAEWIDERVPVPGTKVVAVVDGGRGDLLAALEVVPGSKVYSDR